MSQNINTVLLEARKAYRFLYNYQRRVLDLASYIGGKYGFRYRGGFTKFSDPTPKEGKGHLSCWSWDWLNMYYYEFNFTPMAIGKDGPTLYFSIFILNDSGFFDARDDEDEAKVSKTNTNTFKSVEESRTEMIFVAGRNYWDGWEHDWDGPEFISKPYGEKRNDSSGIMVFKHYSLERLQNEEGAMACIKDFQTLCNEKGIDIKVTAQL